MKRKFALIALLGLFLSGCDGDDPTQYLNKTESVLLKQCEDQTRNLRIYCQSEYEGSIKAARGIYIKNGARNQEDQPFSGQGLTFIIEDKAFKKKHPELRNFDDMWFEYTGKRLYNSSTGSTNDEVKKVDNQYVLSPQMYDELISAVKTCNRATVSSMQFQMGSTLSPEDYNKVMQIILDCKKYQLEKAINDK